MKAFIGVLALGRQKLKQLKHFSLFVGFVTQLLHCADTRGKRRKTGKKLTERSEI